MTGAAVLVVDRLGRRPLLLGGVSGMVSPLGSLDVFIFICLSYKILRSVRFSLVSHPKNADG